MTAMDKTNPLYRQHERIETEAFTGMLKRSLRALARRVGGLHEGDCCDVDSLAFLAEVRRWVDTAERVAVEGCRADGESWQSIADAMGVSKQSAHERFTKPVEVDEWWLS